MFETLLLYLVLGSFAGLIAGLLGVGGGVVIVPALVFVFTEQRVDTEVLMHLALGTSLASIVFTGISSAWSHHRLGAVSWSLVRGLVPALLVGALLGALLADQLTGPWLIWFFGLFEIGIGCYMVLGAPVTQRYMALVLKRLELMPVGMVIGLLSSLLGIGGGSLTVPYLCWRGRSMQAAVAVSSVCGIPIAVAGALGYLLMGLDSESLPVGSLGYIYLPALLGLVSASLFTAPIGAALAHRLPVYLVKRLFGGLLLIVGFLMLI